MAPVISSFKRPLEEGLGSDVADERTTPRHGDASDAHVMHRFDKTAYRQDLGRRECACEECKCGDTPACIVKRCSCCVIQG